MQANETHSSIDCDTDHKEIPYDQLSPTQYLLKVSLSLSTQYLLQVEKE